MRALCTHVPRATFYRLDTLSEELGDAAVSILDPHAVRDIRRDRFARIDTQKEAARVVEANLCSFFAGITCTLRVKTIYSTHSSK